MLHAVEAPRPLLALDCGSPLVSVAVGLGEEVLAARSVEIARSSERLLAMIDEALAEAGTRLADLAGVVALAGPGSFTGLRVGLATALGFHQALGLPAAALPTFEALAVAVPAGDGLLVAAVDALRGEWFTQDFAGSPPLPLAPPRLRRPAEIVELVALAPARLVGFGVGALAASPGWPAATALVEPGALAPAALRRAAEPGQAPLDWDAAALTRPLYLRPPSVTLPKARR